MLSGSTIPHSCSWRWSFLRSWTTTENWFTTLTRGCVPSSSNGCAGGPSGITRPSGPKAARRKTTPPIRGTQCSRWPSRTRSGGVRNCTGPPSSALLASSRWPQLLKMVPHNLLWNAASPEMPLGKGPRIARAAHATIPGTLWIGPFPQRKTFLPRVQHHDSFAHDVPSSALTFMRARCAKHWATVQICSSSGSDTPPLPPPPSRQKKKWDSPKGQKEQDKWYWHLPSIPAVGALGRVVGMRETRKASCGEGPPTPAVPPSQEPASLAYVLSGSATSGWPRRLRMLQVDSATLDLIDSHLDDQDVAEDAVWSLLRHQLRRGAFHFVAAGPPSVRGSRVSSACASTISWRANSRGVQQRRGNFLFCSGDPVWFPVLVRQGAPCRAGTCRSQACRLQAAVSWCRSLGLRSGPAPCPLPLPLLLFCAVTVPSPITIMWIEPISQHIATSCSLRSR